MSPSSFCAATRTTPGRPPSVPPRRREPAEENNPRSGNLGQRGDDPPAGAVVTRPADGDLTHVIAVQLGDGGGDDPPLILLGQLIATLRVTQARAISRIPDERTSVEDLLDAGSGKRRKLCRPTSTCSCSSRGQQT